MLPVLVAPDLWAMKAWRTEGATPFAHGRPRRLLITLQRNIPTYCDAQ